MEMLEKKKLIIYGIEKEEKEALEKGFEELTEKDFILIKENMGKYTLKDILFENEKQNSEKLLPMEKVIIFNGFQGVELQGAVSKVRTVLKDKPILAATTPTSIEMELSDLLEHLIQERELHRMNMMKKSST